MKNTYLLTLLFCFSLSILFAQGAPATPPATKEPDKEAKASTLPPFCPTFTYTAEQINKIASDCRNVLDQKLEEIIKIPADKRTFDNTVLALENAFTGFNDLVNMPQFLAYVSDDKATRDAGNALEEETGKYMVEVSTRRDLYNAVDEFSKTGPKLPPEDAFLLDRTMLDFKRSGLSLPEKELTGFKELKKKLVEQELKFGKNLRDYKDQLEVTKEQLAGLPEDYIKKLTQTKDGKYIVTLDYPDYIPFMDNAKDEDARRQIELKFNNRCASDNEQIFENALELREKLAKMLGYKSHAEYVLDDRMARKPGTVNTFLDGLREKLLPKGQAELKSRLELKAKEAKTPVATVMEVYNWRYWNDQFRKINLELDSDMVRQYFPTEYVVPEMLKIFEEIFEIKMVKVELPVWNPDVTAFQFQEKNGDIIGYFYLDLYPRDGKYKHMACFPLYKGKVMPDGHYRKPSAAIVGNFPKPGKDSPSLMSHSEVETLFHEFGHVTHNMFTRAKYESFAGTSVARDFVEVPSTMLENLVWKAEVLKRLSSNVKNPAEKLPDDLIKKMIDNRNFDAGMLQLRQLFFSKFDIAVHTSELKNTLDVYKKMMIDIMLLPMSEGTHPQASFGHLMGGYDSGYYGYLWARVISSDLFSEFEKNGLFDAKTGKKYRDLILSTGRVADVDAQIEQFLGRKFNEDAFIKNLGLTK